MQIFGELVNNKIIVKKSKDVGRLYCKSNLGITTTGNRLSLNLLEGVFLLGEEKIRIFQDRREIDFQNLVKKAAEHIFHFEIKYLIFRDLRKRGFFVKLIEENNDYDLYLYKRENEEGKKGKLCLISAFSERDIVDINKIKHLIEFAVKQGGELWFSIVDEEGDLTYYDVSKLDIKGKVRGHKFSKTTGILLENRIVIFDKKLSRSLLEKEFFGKPFGDGLQLSMVEALYLMEKNVIDIKNVVTGRKNSVKEFKKFIHKSQPDIDLRITVFNDLKKRGLIVKTGFKFGANFRAYTKKPDNTHAEYLIHTVDKNFKRIWVEISRAVRLAHSVNKEIMFARVEENNIDYIRFGRLRP